MVGSAIVRKLLAQGHGHIVGSFASRVPQPIAQERYERLDLLDAVAVAEFFAREKPEYVFLAAAKVGGIVANNRYRAQFIYQNLQIQSNVIHQSYVHGVRKLLFLGSSCIYPKLAPQPMREEHLLTGELEYTNEPYAIAKIAGLKMCESYNLEHGTNFVAVMPTNLYGYRDNFDLEKSHVLPALVRKMHLAKALREGRWDLLRRDLDQNPIGPTDGNASREQILEALARHGVRLDPEGQAVVELWGTGSPRREFLHADDLAEACLFLMRRWNFAEAAAPRGKEVRNTHINIGVGHDLSIRELAGLVREVVGFEGRLDWDSQKPDGTPRKLLDVSQLAALGWTASIPFRQGIEQVYQDYLRGLED